MNICSDEVTMSSVQNLRELINERLTAAAEEIFTEFEKTIVQYEEEIDRQRRLLDNIWKPQITQHTAVLPQVEICNEEDNNWKLQITLHTTELPLQQICTEEEEVPAEQNVCNQERNSSVDQEDPEPLQMKEEHMEICTNLDQEDPEPLQMKEEHMEICNSLDQENPEPPQLKEEQEELCTNLDQENPEPPQMKEEHEELCNSRDQENPEPLQLKEEQEELCNSRDQENPEPLQLKEEHEELCNSRDRQQSGQTAAADTSQKADSFMLVQYKSKCEELAREKFSISEDTIGHYEEATDCHRRPFNITKNLQIKLHRIDLQQQHIYEEQEVVSDHLLRNQERNFCLDQKDLESRQIKEAQEKRYLSRDQDIPKLPQIKEQQKELYCSQEREQLDAFKGTSEESDHSEPEPPKCVAKPVPNRHYLLCPVCNKSQDCLSVHLERTCMKQTSKDERAKVVEKAKEEASVLLRSGRVYTYQLLQDILGAKDPLKRLIGELQRRNSVVTNVPSAVPSTAAQLPDVQAGPSTATGRPDSPEESSDDTSESSGETFQCNRNPKWKINKRARMADLGLYQKHSLDHPLLKGFATHLRKDLSIENFKQEVDNVARFLFFMDPAEPSLMFVREREKTQEYLRKLSDAKLGNRTQLNYLKSLKRFLNHRITNTDMFRTDAGLHNEAKQYTDFIGSLQKQLAKGISKEIVAKRDRIILGDMTTTPHDCTAVLRAAKKDFLAILGKIDDTTQSYDCQLETSECLIVLYYLEAIVVLKHLQKPGVVEHMTIEEWKNRSKLDKGFVAISVKEHKTATQQVAVFVLSAEEEAWFDKYFECVRDQLKTTKRFRASPEAENVEEDPQERFFLSTSGKPIHNCSNDLARLHTKYNLTPVTSQVVRRIFETAAKCMPDVDKAMIADYLTHSTATAEKHYHMKQGGYLIRSLELLDELRRHDDSEEGPSSRAHPKSRNPRMDFEKEWNNFSREHPVTVDGKVPSLVHRAAVSQDSQRKLYERWLKKQMKLRIQHAAAQFPRRLPTESRVAGWISKQGWKRNIPSASKILEAWQPTGDFQDIPTSAAIRKLVSSQRWKGLVISHIEGKGRAVLTTRSFKAGEVLCDYHGEVVTSDQTHAATSLKETDFMFFYKNGAGEKFCIDAHLDKCPCHPDRETFGRLINHSRKRPNIRPRLFSLKFESGERDVLLFMALRDIKAGEELLFNYGVNRQNYCGEGLDLEWND
ncbi:uncharacterized protein LOC110945292 isoform X2 [Acanthochromis polyacanthus]|uniref:uncharacterized protein LOC110945292 isoform X2 n=1 Tax=Acanthochromis polyacanthus TaxID=80966 RepID=UPI002234DEF3|nr:uncharacterized protein LOC110945292 isoform X2 [Acanthochromis polyacanthus]